jgi:hypothetical protein
MPCLVRSVESARQDFLPGQSLAPLVPSAAHFGRLHWPLWPPRSFFFVLPETLSWGAFTSPSYPMDGYDGDQTALAGFL